MDGLWGALQSKSRAVDPDKFNRQRRLTAGRGSGYNESVSRITSRPTSFNYGGDTASTGVKTRGMHAEPHRLVNPVEHNVTADTQLALAA